MASDNSARTAMRLMAFASAGAITTTQEIVTVIRSEIPDADPDVVAEETLSLVSVASARAVEAGAGEAIPDAVPATLLELPFAYHDYLLGGLMLSGRDAGRDSDRSVYDRLERKREFYSVHLAPGQLPSPRYLRDKMELWMGRISPPGLPEHPAKRLERLALVDVLATHVRLLYEFTRNQEAAPR